MNGNSPELQARNLGCLRGESWLFERLSFGVARGEIVQIEGTNGSGKTSLLRILAGLRAPSEGQVLWRGGDIAERRAAFWAEAVYLGHHLGLKAELSVAENLRFAAALRGPIQSSVAAALATVGLAERGDALVGTLSAGQRQRVALARVIASGASLWLLDEPFTALDASGIALVQKLLDEHAAQGGLAVLSSHQAVALSGGLSRLTLA